MDSHKAFIVKYALDEDTELAEHFDNAEVTLNVAISQDYEGGELVFKNSSGNELITCFHEFLINKSTNFCPRIFFSFSMYELLVFDWYQNRQK